MKKAARNKKHTHVAIKNKVLPLSSSALSLWDNVAVSLTWHPVNVQQVRPAVFISTVDLEEVKIGSDLLSFESYYSL